MKTHHQDALHILIFWTLILSTCTSLLLNVLALNTPNTRYYTVEELLNADVVPPSLTNSSSSFGSSSSSCKNKRKYDQDHHQFLLHHHSQSHLHTHHHSSPTPHHVQPHRWPHSGRDRVRWRRSAASSVPSRSQPQPQHPPPQDARPWSNSNLLHDEGGEQQKVTAILGENVILGCSFDFPEGVPVPYVIQWQKQGVKVPIYIWYDGYPPHTGEGYENRVSLTGQASLNLTNVQEGDQGWYSCMVYFLNRSPDAPKNGTWVRLDVHAPPRFSIKPPDVVYVKIGETVSLTCEAQGTPAPTIIWYKDSLPIEESAHIQILPTELKINNLQQSDIGDYSCMARNREGSVSAPIKVIVAGPAVITVPPRNLTKLEGDKAEFICEAKALPSNVTHRWYHNGVEINQLSWLETRTLVRRDGTLFINPTSAEDSGKYTCEVYNGIGNPDLASAYLSIEYPARVTYSPTIQYLPLNMPGIIRCFVQANPPLQFVTWTKDRRPFEPSSNPGVETLNNGSLLFHKVSLEHQGLYRCTPYNIHGTSGMSNVMEVLVRGECLPENVLLLHLCLRSKPP